MSNNKSAKKKSVPLDSSLRLPTNESCNQEINEEEDIVNQVQSLIHNLDLN